MTPESREERELLELLLAKTPLIDVRAPVEFAKGSIPGAVNLPLLTDDERAAVGTAYKRKGQEAAVALGHSILSGKVREQRLDAWEKFARSHPNAWVYCFRGGMRSNSVHEVLRRERDIDVPVISGGYKRARNQLIEVLDRLSASEDFAILTGFTGAGKTELLKDLARSRRVVDLEGLAHHRGSAFGKKPGVQPSQADFENALALELVKLNRVGGAPIVLEDESRMIGRVTLPEKLFARISEAPLVVLETPLAERALRLIEEYLSENYGIREGAVGPAEVFTRFHADMLANIEAISPRLGGAEAKLILAMVDSAIAEQRRTGAMATHVEWVMRLLEKYYDPIYLRHLERNEKRVVFRGNTSEVMRYFNAPLSL